MRTLLSGLLIVLLLAGVGCTHALHHYHTGDFSLYEKKPGIKRVSSAAEQFTIMGFVQDTNYVNSAFANLEKRCPDGDLTGIQTRYSSSHGFFSWRNTVKMTAFCVPR